MTGSSETRGKTHGRTSHRVDRAETTTRLHELRVARGLGATELARQAGVTRQTIYAIESGDFVPNTAVALKLAGLLEVSVEELFSLNAVSTVQPPGDFSVELLATGEGKHSAGELVRIGRVGSRTVAVPAPHFPTFLSDADGTIVRQSNARAIVHPIVEPESGRNTLVVAGCDPALSVLSSELRSAGTQVINVPCSSRVALDWLKRGFVHVAGTHLRDRATGEYNLPLVKGLFGKENYRAITFAEWEQGLVVRRGNPKRIHTVADLGGGHITIVNRKKGAGARDLLDTHLRAAGISPRTLYGYDRIAPSHMAAAVGVANSEADCCVATVSAARCLGLDFVPLSNERFDLIISSSDVDSTAMRGLFDALNRASLRRKLATLAGYETRHTGETLM